MSKEIALRLWKQKRLDVEAGKSAEDAERISLEKQIAEFMKLIPVAKSDSVRGRYEAKVEELDQRVLAIKRSPVHKKEPNFEEALALTLRLLGTPAETWQKVGLELKRMVHSMIFTNDLSYSLEKGFGTPSLSLPFSIKDHITVENGKVVEVARVSLASRMATLTVLHAQSHVSTNRSGKRRSKRLVPS